MTEPVVNVEMSPPLTVLVEHIESPPVEVEVPGEPMVVEVALPGTAAEYYTFFYGSTLAQINGLGRDIVMSDGTITEARAAVDQAPEGNDIVLRLEVAGVQVALLAIPDGQKAGAALGLDVAVLAGDYVTVDITQVGSTFEGSTLTVKVKKAN